MPTNPNIMIFIKGLDIGGLSGGADLLGANLASELHRIGWKVSLIICNRYQTESELSYIKLLNEKGIKPEFLANWNDRPTVLYYLTALIKLNQLVENRSVDIFHTHFHTGSFFAVLLRLFGRVKRIIRTAHVDHEWQRGWNGLLKQAIIRSLIFVVFPVFFNLEVGVSTYAVTLLNQRLIAKILRKRALVIPNAIPSHNISSSKISSTRFTGWLGDHPVIGSVGRLEQQKGYRYFIGALPSTLQLFPDLEVWLIGDGPLRGELEEQCRKLHISDNVKFWGKRSDVPNLLSKMDIFISSSIYEGLPSVVLEAMDAGVPCIVTAIAGTEDIVTEENALVINKSDCQALADAIILLLNTPVMRKQLVENALNVVSRFYIDKITQDYIEAYKNL